MKKDIHPKYYTEAKITCACGNVIIAGSTVPEMKIEICSACHPLYTGKKKLMDTTGRVERFKNLTKKTAKKKAQTEKATEQALAKKKKATKKTATKKVTAEKK